MILNDLTSPRNSSIFYFTGFVLEIAKITKKWYYFRKNSRIFFDFALFFDIENFNFQDFFYIFWEKSIFIFILNLAKKFFGEISYISWVIINEIYEISQDFSEKNFEKVFQNFPKKKILKFHETNSKISRKKILKLFPKISRKMLFFWFYFDFLSHLFRKFLERFFAKYWYFHFSKK